MDEVAKWQTLGSSAEAIAPVEVPVDDSTRGTRVPWLAALGLVLALAGAGAVWNFGSRGKLDPSNTHRSQDVVLVVQNLARLETTRFHMGNVVQRSSLQTGGLAGVFHSEDVLVLIAEADVIAGVDLAKLRPADVVADEDRRSVRVTLPAPEIFSASLDTRRTRVFRRDTDVLAEASPTLESEARLEAESTIRGTAVEQGILVQAEDQARRVVRGLFAAAGFEVIEINFATSEMR